MVSFHIHSYTVEMKGDANQYYADQLHGSVVILMALLSNECVINFVYVAIDII